MSLHGSKSQNNVIIERKNVLTSLVCHICFLYDFESVKFICAYPVYKYVFVVLWLLDHLCISRDFSPKISDILDEMGRASAIAQGLQKAVTSGERLRNSDHTVYLLIDTEGKR